MYFPDVTLLVTHYNRSSSLERLLSAFEQLDCRFENIVVSDDGSRPEHLAHLRSLQTQYAFNLVTTPVNKGLGNNINKGQDAVTTPYTLYVQEDFVPQNIFPRVFSDAIGLISERPDLDVIRFYAYFAYPYLKPCRNGFSEMIFRWTLPGYRKFYYYSDHPHLRRNTFFSRFGRYCEGIKVEATEYRMMMSFLANRGKALFYDNYTSVFEQVNSTSEPSTVKRNFWRESGNPLVSVTRDLYRHARFNLDYLFSRRL
jgi:glycosyltransferase involved in cell wall biosynthesis